MIYLLLFYSAFATQTDCGLAIKAELDNVADALGKMAKAIERIEEKLTAPVHSSLNKTAYKKRNKPKKN